MIAQSAVEGGSVCKWHCSSSVTRFRRFHFFGSSCFLSLCLACGSGHPATAPPFFRVTKAVEEQLATSADDGHSRNSRARRPYVFDVRCWSSDLRDVSEPILSVRLSSRFARFILAPRVIIRLAISTRECPPNRRSEILLHCTLASPNHSIAHTQSMAEIPCVTTPRSLNA